jgi:Ca-activated chloride channel family protein
MSRLRPRMLALVAAGCLGLAAAVGLVLAQDAQQRRGFSVHITEPVMEEVVVGKTLIAAEVKIDDERLLDRVEFMVGDKVVFVDREAPFEFWHDFGEEQRSWIIRVVAWHKEGVSVSDVVVTRKAGFVSVEQVNRVVLWVSATDKDGNFITDLARDDFRVFEDDKEQKLIDFYVETRAITMAILIDASGSMRDTIKEVHHAAGAFVDTLRDIDRALVIDFDDNVFLIQELTADRDALREAITSTEPMGATSLYDAIHASYRKIGQIEGRKAVILLSDGEDTSSLFGYKRVLDEAKSSNTMIYAIGIGSPDKGVLNEFAQVTGGKAFFVDKADELSAVYQRIADELRNQYYLTYSTSNQDWDGHWIKIRVDNLRQGIKVRSRSGYFAVRKH